MKIVVDISRPVSKKNVRLGLLMIAVIITILVLFIFEFVSICNQP